MKIKHLSIALFAIMAINQNANALSDNTITKLTSLRSQVIELYILDLARADDDGISALFEEGGIVVSTSRGKVLAPDFFHSFLPLIETAHTEINQIFVNPHDENRYAARFHFDFKLKDGEEGSGEYIDEFIFTPNSASLKAVYMFENLKFTQE